MPKPLESRASNPVATVAGTAIADVAAGLGRREGFIPSDRADAAEGRLLSLDEHPLEKGLFETTLMDCDTDLAEKALEWIGKGANPRAKNSFGFTPLHLAVSRGDLVIDLINALIPHSDLSAQTPAGDTALMIAMQRPSVRAQTVEALFCGATGIAVNNNGQTVLMLAAENLSSRWVRAFLPHCDARARDLDGHSALMFAANFGDAENVRLLLPHSDPFAKSNAGTDAFSCALQDAQNHDEWGCLDLMAPWGDAQLVDVQFQRLKEEGRAHEMPLWAARLEAQAIQQAMDDAKGEPPLANTSAVQEPPSRPKPRSL